jgi:aspartate beta-hydroxylase
MASARAAARTGVLSRAANNLRRAAMSRAYDLGCKAVSALYDHSIATPPILDLNLYFPEHELFAHNWHRIRDECLGAIQDVASVPQFHELMEEQRPLSTHGGKYWRMFLLKAYGSNHRRNQARCPFTTSLLKRAGSVQSATFSILEGRKHIPVHRGPFRGVLRYHLGLVIPRKADGSSSNRLKIDGTTYELKEGGEMLWDDTYPHEAWNDSEEVRAVLILDVIRPGMSLPLKLVTKAIIALVRFWIALKGERA